MDRRCNKKKIQVKEREISLPECLNSCPEHKLESLTDISLDDCERGFIFKCRICQKSSKNLDIQEIAFSQDSHIFDHYPILPEDLRQKIKEILEQRESMDTMVEQIKLYFKNLKIKIVQSISDMEEEMIVKAQEIDSFQQNLIDQYTKQSRKIELRDIIFDDQNITQKSELVKEIVQDVVKKSNQIESKLMEMIATFDQNNQNIKSQNLKEISIHMIQSFIQQIQTQEMQNTL